MDNYNDLNLNTTSVNYVSDSHTLEGLVPQQAGATVAFLPATVQAPLLQAILGLQPALQPVIQGGGAKDPLGGFGELLGPLLAAQLKKGKAA